MLLATSSYSSSPRRAIERIVAFAFPILRAVCGIVMCRSTSSAVFRAISMGSSFRVRCDSSVTGISNPSGLVPQDSLSKIILPNAKEAALPIVAATFKKWRAAVGLVQVEAAAQIGVRQNALSKWERGIVEKMTVDSIVGIARVYRQPVEEVVALVTGSPSLAEERRKRHAAFRRARADLLTKAPRMADRQFELLYSAMADAYRSYMDIAISDQDGRKDAVEWGLVGLRDEAERMRAAPAATADVKKRDTR